MVQIRWFLFLSCGLDRRLSDCVACFTRSGLSMRWHYSERLVAYGLAAILFVVFAVCSLQIVIRSTWINRYEVSNLLMTTIPIRNWRIRSRRLLLLSKRSLSVMHRSHYGLRTSVECEALARFIGRIFKDLKQRVSCSLPKLKKRPKRLSNETRLATSIPPMAPEHQWRLACLWRGLPIKRRLRTLIFPRCCRPVRYRCGSLPIGCPEVKSSSPNCMLAEVNFNQTQVSSLIGLSKFHIAQNNAPKLLKISRPSWRSKAITRKH